MIISYLEIFNTFDVHVSNADFYQIIVLSRSYVFHHLSCSLQFQ
jgi:hypothetical protein